MPLDDARPDVTTDGSRRDTPADAHGVTLAAPADARPLLAAGSAVFRPGVLTFGDYEVIGELGEGGMGRVYKAQDRKLGRLVAVKVLKTTDPLECSRFQGEAGLIAKFEHPNIVQVFDIGTTADGRPYLVLEFAEGGSLDRELNKQPQPPRRAAEMVETIAKAVQYAHEKGVIHRDLKPGNILLSKDKVLKLTDFGLAKHLGSASSLTATGQVMGTPNYMAPEQAGGQAKELDGRADVYALGVILYEMLTGRPPFQAAALPDLLEQVRWAEPASPTLLIPRLPRDLSTICLKCLQKSPARRYQTAGALADDLRRWLNGETIAARPAPGWERLLRQVKRRPWEAATVVACGLLLAVVGGAGLYAREKSRVRAEHDERQQLLAAERDAHAKEQKKRADEALQVLEGIRRQLTDGELRSTPGLDALNAVVTDFYRKLLDQRLLDPAADRAELARLLLEIGGLAERSGQFAVAEWGFQNAHELYAGLPSDLPAHLANREAAARAKAQHARAVFDLGRDEEAMRLADAAHALWAAVARDTTTAEPALKRAAGPHPDALAFRQARSQLAELELFRGEVHFRRHELDAARAAFVKSIDLRKDIGGERLDYGPDELARLEGLRRVRAVADLRELGRGYGWLGDVYLAEGHVARTDQAYWDSHAIRKKVAEALRLAKNPTKDDELERERAQFQLARGWDNLSRFQTRLGAYPTAAAFAKEALELREALVAGSPNNIDYKVDLCNNLNRMAELELLDATRKPDGWGVTAAGVERAIRLVSASDAYRLRAAPSLAESHALRAEVSDRQRRPDDAAAAAAEARRRFEELCRLHPNQPNHQFRLATVLALEARLKGAAPDAEAWREVFAALGRAAEKGYRGKRPDAVRELPAFAPVRNDPRFAALLTKLPG